ncbi:MAG: GTPase [Deltaproteobacteria bacterium]|nr:GTPase [Deltaproteobacteria bacterium]
MTQKVVIMGAAGKDFHVFNTVYRGNAQARVVAFTATQIPGIDGRRYPASLAGDSYPDGIPIVEEERLAALIRDEGVDHVVFAYSDVSWDYIAARRALVEAAGATFETAPIEETMIPSSRPVIAVCAVRTGCGKSQTTRKVMEILQQQGLRVVAVRHPMPYGDLAAQAVQRFATLEDLQLHHCTIEEMEEYEPHIQAGSVVYAGVDYEAILRQAEEEADVILWDGGNNDLPFFKPDLHITIVDPHRPGHELSYYPGSQNLERADVVLFNKMDTAPEAGIQEVEASVQAHNPHATVIYADSPVATEHPELVRGRRVLVVEDGPTLTHGGMTFGAGVVAARALGCTLVDPRPWTTGTIRDTFAKYPGIGELLPAMGYSEGQIADLEATIAATDCEAVIIGTPIDLGRLIRIDKPHTRVSYSLQERSGPKLESVIKAALGL